MTFDCKDALKLIASYADGELSEAQAGLLRKHLLACSTCRVAMQDEKALKRWFAPLAAEPAPAVPADFAARVARRAFAGDTGQPAALGPAALRGESLGRVRQFVLELSVLAAAAALVFVVAIRRARLPEGRLQADETAPSLSELRERLERLELEAPSADPAAPNGALAPRPAAARAPAEEGAD